MNRVNENNCRSEKSQVQRGYRKVKCAISQALVMINLYVKFNVHSSYVKQVIVLKSGGQTYGRTRNVLARGASTRLFGRAVSKRTGRAEF